MCMCPTDEGLMSYLQMYSTGVCYVLCGIWPGGKNCSCVWLFWCSVALAKGQQFKAEPVSWMLEVQSDFLSPFPHSGGVKFLEAGQRSTDNPLSSPDCPL